MKKSKKGRTKRIKSKKLEVKKIRSKSIRSKSIRSKIIRRGGNLMKQNDFSKMYKGKEKEYYKNYETCVRKCHKISSKKNIKGKNRCFKSCSDKRLKDIQDVQKKYPKEWKIFLNNL